ncbi:TonB-dependent receptor [Campylobacter canadensis]|uniref:TonB-dependent receptor n=1 Tax=Campylobacter canadensis TaxID=449520 RepID=A0ABS7WPI3_9BACT|nr:TonB-dependent receptor [Campylobacter canadensis]MBZ7986670.1 TonB-dependent receptor [Campylobacter canadensis]MBZ7993925.1 TonB-dependent receptor [Campylobacter canadensis]MBZ7996241.1 TonB-dependent receptor [Campylobacter canadensis]MBZ7997706.1 TonB-dependent receptor [Campylobacter canadensis]MBZ7999258.1 TonB-dependent receptor [Campylobacter canadensis]
MKKYLLLSVVTLSALANTNILQTQVISSSGFTQSLKDTSHNVLVLSKEDIENKGYKDIYDALKTFPSISIARTGTSDSIDIRGQGAKANTRVKIFIDGVLINPSDNSHLATPLDFINIDEVEQIEVIAGGGSVIYGDGAVGGVVNIISKKYSKMKDYANIRLKTGSFDHKSLSLNAGTFLQDRVFLNLSYNKIDEGGYQRADKNKSDSASLALKFLLSDNTDLSFDTSYKEEKIKQSAMLDAATLLNDRRSGGLIQTAFYPKPAYINAAEQDFTINKYLSTSLKLNYHNEDFELAIIPYYFNYSYDDSNLKDEKVALTIKSIFNANEITKLSLGYDYSYNNGLRNQGSIKNEVNKTTNSLFANSLFALNAFDLSFGLRFENSKYNVKRFSSNILALSDDNNYNNLAFNTIFSKALNDDLKAYFKFESGFSSPTPYELTDKVNNEYKINNVKAEKYLTYELGLKGLVFDNFAQLAFFYTDTKDEIYINMTSGRPPHATGLQWTYNNISKTQRYGAELSLNQMLLDDTLSLNESFSYINAKVKNDELNPYKNKQYIPLVPKYKINLNASYEFINNYFARINYSYLSKQNWDFAKDTNNNYQGGYGLVDIGFSIKAIKNLDINIDAKNIFAKEYNIYCSNNLCQPAAKQTFYLETRYSF